MVSAVGLLPSLHLLTSSGPEHLRACSIVGGLVVECALKAFLSHTGIAENKLRDSLLRHNLEALWAKAAERGLFIKLPTPQWCVTLNSLHDQPYHLRYQSKVHGLSFPVPSDMIAGLSALVATVELALTQT